MNATQPGGSITALREPIKLPSTVLWIVETTAGYGLGMTASTYFIGSFMRPLGPVLWGLFNVFTYGAIAGILLGVLQFIVMPRRLVPFLGWLLATLAGAGAGFAVASVAAEALANAMDITWNALLVQGLISLTAGLLIGIFNGLGQWLVLRQSLPHVRSWIPATGLGMVLGTVAATALLGLFELPLLSDAPTQSVGVILGVAVGIAQALVLWRNRRQ